MKSTNLQWKFTSSIGPLYLVASSAALLGLYWKKQNVPIASSLSDSPLLQQAVTEVKEYLSGERKKFTVPLDLKGSEFQVKVWNELLKIPYGKTRSYKELAQLIQNEKAIRAVGTANGKNPISLIVPCHRVIASDGTLGGYAGGLSIKARLLKLEGWD